MLQFLILILKPILSLLGFTAVGVAAGSTAAWAQAVFYGAIVPAGSLFAILQSFGARM